MADANVDLLKQFNSLLRDIHQDLTAVNDKMSRLDRGVRSNTKELEEVKKKLARYSKSLTIIA